MKVLKQKTFANGTVYAAEVVGGYPIEITDTFLPYCTKDAIGRKQNKLDSKTDIGSRSERWMIGVSCMSGCPIGCKFCATGQLKKWRRLYTLEILSQIDYVLKENYRESFIHAKEHKINYTRMGEPFLLPDTIKEVVQCVDKLYPDTHHYISTIGIQGSDFSWIKDNITLQISLHSLNEERRRELIPYSKLMTLEELGKIRTESNLKTTLNLTLVDEEDFDIDILKKYFDPEYFFIKLSPINKNEVSEMNNLGAGIVEGVNLI